MAAPAPIRLCHVGAGRLGTFRLSLFRKSPVVRCVAVVERDRANAVWTKRVPEGPTPFATIAEVNIPFDAIWISSPTKLHPALIAEAAERTKFIFCEKPIASTAGEVQQCYKICREKGAELLPGWMRRFDEYYHELYNEVTVPTQVDVAAVHLVSKDWPVVPVAFLKSLGSIFTDLMCHDFNLCCLFMNNEVPISVEAHGKDTTGIGLWDAATCIVEYKGGRFVFMEASRFSDSKRYDNTARIFTPSGKMHITRRGQDVFSFFERYTAAFTAEVGFFASVVRGDSVQRRNTERSCVVTSIIIEMAEKSAKMGRRMVLDRDYDAKL